MLQNKQHNIILQKSRISKKPGLDKTVGENQPGDYLCDLLLNVVPKCASDEHLIDPLGNGRLRGVMSSSKEAQLML